MLQGQVDTNKVAFDKKRKASWCDKGALSIEKIAR